ncbi:MAG: hypothetical protein ACU85U_19500 [Gammaproteobacteria bacterium]|jgi:hypothetical protein
MTLMAVLRYRPEIPGCGRCCRIVFTDSSRGNGGVNGSEEVNFDYGMIFQPCSGFTLLGDCTAPGRAIISPGLSGDRLG